MTNIGTIFRSFIDAVNQGQWAQIARFFDSHLCYMDHRVTLEDYISSLEGSASIFQAKKTVDVLVQDDESGQLGARLIVRAIPTRALEDGDPAGQPIEYPEHIICKFEDSKITDIKSITDMDVVREGLSHIEPSSETGPRVSDGANVDLAQMYTSYTRCINSQTMATELHKYCQPHVTWCGRHLALVEYRMLMEDSFSAISGLVFKVRHLVVDKERQQLAVRIEFSGTPVKEYAGVEPNGKAVNFAEHAFYWVEDGKISRVSTVIDWDAYRRQMREP